MADLVLIDSNVYIGLLRRRLDPVQVLGEWIEQGDLATCGMVRVEVERGLRHDSVRRKVASFLDLMINVPTNDRIWKQTADLAWALDRRGLVIPVQDALIAVAASSIGAAVMTDDSHFDDVPGLRILRPREELDSWVEE